MMLDKVKGLCDMYPMSDCRLRECLATWFNHDWCIDAYNESLKLLGGRRYTSVYEMIDGLVKARGNFNIKDYMSKSYGFLTWGYSSSRDDKSYSVKRYLHRFTYGKTMSLSRYLCYCFYVMFYYEYYGCKVLSNVVRVMMDVRAFTGDELIYVSKNGVILIENGGVTERECNSARHEYENLLCTMKRSCYGVYVELCIILEIDYKKYDDISDFNLNVDHLSSFKFFGKFRSSSFFSITFGEKELRLPHAFIEDNDYYKSCKKRLSSCCNDIRVNPRYKLFKDRFIGV